METKKLLNLLGGAIALGTFGVLLYFENRRPLRRRVESKFTRGSRNLTIAGLAAIALQLAEQPIVAPLTKLVERKNIGLLKIARLPGSLEAILAVLLMDYTLYVWHVLTHRISFLWRFHLVHHVDLDLDASTALRFHFGEIIVSAAWRAAQIVVIGVSPVSFAAWQMFLFPSILFHHSNVRLPVDWEEKISRLIVTPRMHGIHHSTERKETDSNWSSGLTVWDWLHGTLKTNVPEDKMIIGVPAYQKPEEVVLTKILPLPFGKQKSAWDSSPHQSIPKFKRTNLN